MGQADKHSFANAHSIDIFYPPSPAEGDIDGGQRLGEATPFASLWGYQDHAFALLPPQEQDSAQPTDKSED
jgi:hypothetical protein